MIFVYKCGCEEQQALHKDDEVVRIPYVCEDCEAKKKKPRLILKPRGDKNEPPTSSV